MQGLARIIRFAHLNTAIFLHSPKCSNSIILHWDQLWIVPFKFSHTLSHSRAFTLLSLNHLCVAFALCVRSLSCWEINLDPSWRSLAAKIRLSPLLWEAVTQYDATTTMCHRGDCVFAAQYWVSANHCTVHFILVSSDIRTFFHCSWDFFLCYSLIKIWL